MLSFLFHLYCRILHGHIMVKFGSDRTMTGYRRDWYMCARCLRLEMFQIPEEVPR